MEYLCFIYLFLYTASSFKAITDSQSFLFTLINPSANEPVKISSKPGASIRCESNCGPSFGTTSYYDLQVWSSDPSYDSASGYLDLGYGFMRPEKVNKTKYFTGNCPFDINELEVFKVNL